MTDVNKRNRFARKKSTIVVAGLAIALSATVVLMLQQPVLAQNQSSNTQTVPDLKGSVNVQNATSDFLKQNAKVSFVDAATIAKAQVDNGAVIGGRLGVVQGYLVYTFNVANYDAGTSRIVIVDAGNGSMLYKSDEMPLHFGGFGGPGCGWHASAYGNYWNGMMKGTTSAGSNINNTNA